MHFTDQTSLLCKRIVQNSESHFCQDHQGEETERMMFGSAQAGLYPQNSGAVQCNQIVTVETKVYNSYQFLRFCHFYPKWLSTLPSHNFIVDLNIDQHSERLGFRSANGYPPAQAEDAWVIRVMDNVKGLMKRLAVSRSCLNQLVYSMLCKSSYTKCNLWMEGLRTSKVLWFAHKMLT